MITIIGSDGTLGLVTCSSPAASELLELIPEFNFLESSTQVPFQLGPLTSV